MPYKNKEDKLACAARYRLQRKSRGTALSNSNDIASRIQPSNIEREQRRKAKYLRAILKRHQLSVEQFEQMLKDQNYICGICHTFEPTWTHPRLCVDHDHKTGKVRGLLCAKCNGGLGNFRDNPSYLEKAITYLKNTSQDSPLNDPSASLPADSE